MKGYKEIGKSVALVLIVGGLVFYLFIAPAMKPKVAQVISEKDMVLAGTAPDGSKLYYNFEEQTQPLELIKPLIPFMIAVLPYVLRKNQRSK